jgi:lipoyl(octanoyl) transferase
MTSPTKCSTPEWLMPEWTVSEGLTEYSAALKAMEDRASGISEGRMNEQIWLVEHPPVYTAGTSADPAELLSPQFPVITAGRGGRYTYHGPGQRVGYVMLNLADRGRDIRCYVSALEGWVIDALAELGVESWRAPGRIGIWTEKNGREVKIGAIGVRVRRWVTFHGFAINIAPDLSHFEQIIPCGLPDFGVTSLSDLGVSAGFEAVDAALSLCFPRFLEKISEMCKNT